MVWLLKIYTFFPVNFQFQPFLWLVVDIRIPIFLLCNQKYGRLHLKGNKAFFHTVIEWFLYIFSANNFRGDWLASFPMLISQKNIAFLFYIKYSIFFSEKSLVFPVIQDYFYNIQYTVIIKDIKANSSRNYCLKKMKLLVRKLLDFITRKNTQSWNNYFFFFTLNSP